MPFKLPNADEIGTVLASVGKKDSHDIAEAFRNRSAENDEFGWGILAEIFDMHFRRSNAAEPFGPKSEMDGRRTIIPDDLTDEQIDALRQKFEVIAMRHGIEKGHYIVRSGWKGRWVSMGGAARFHNATVEHSAITRDHPVGEEVPYPSCT
jgi:hypothetical protein